MKTYAKSICFSIIASMCTAAVSLIWKHISFSLQGEAHLFLVILSSPSFYLAGMLALLSLVNYYLAVKNGKVSVVAPLMSLNFLWIMLAAALFFKEPITLRMIISNACIILGVIFLTSNQSRQARRISIAGDAHD